MMDVNQNICAGTEKKVKVQAGIASWICPGCGVGQYEFVSGKNAIIQIPLCFDCRQKKRRKKT